MEDQSYVPFAPTDDGVDQSSDSDCGEAVCADEVHRPQDGGGHWSSRPGSELPEKEWYRVRGSYLNTLIRMSIDNFNREHNDKAESLSYSEAFWNGYGWPSPACETSLGTIPLIQRCNDAYWFSDSRYHLSDSVRMASALRIVADEVQTWSDTALERGTEIVALTLRGVAERLRDAADGKR